MRRQYHTRISGVDARSPNWAASCLILRGDTTAWNCFLFSLSLEHPAPDRALTKLGSLLPILVAGGSPNQPLPKLGSLLPILVAGGAPDQPLPKLGSLLPILVAGGSPAAPWAARGAQDAALTISRISSPYFSAVRAPTPSHSWSA